MAAAVADYRPQQADVDLGTKHRRSAEGLTLSLEPTPDLLKLCSDHARPDQLMVGFALEPSDRLEESARSKLARKGIDVIVANPLETMGSDTIHARLIGNTDRSVTLDTQTDGRVTKPEFARWLIDQLDQLIQLRITTHDADQEKRPSSESSPHAPF